MSVPPPIPNPIERPLAPTYIIGHKNPDADAICSAMAYAAFKEAFGNGGIVTEMTLTTFAPDRFWLISAAAGERHDEHWLREHLPAAGVRLDNLSARYGTLILVSSGYQGGLAWWYSKTLRSPA